MSTQVFRLVVTNQHLTPMSNLPQISLLPSGAVNKHRVVPFGTPLKVGLNPYAMRSLPYKLGELAIKHAWSNVMAQGFVDDYAPKRWAPRKDGSDPGRPILVKTGAMLRSIKILGLMPNKVMVGSSVPYSGIHNRPVGEMKQYSTGNYPGRKFLGHAKILRDLSVAMIVDSIKRGLHKI